MRHYIFVISLILGSYSFVFGQHEQHLSQTNISEDLYYSEVSDSIFMITHFFPYWGGNSMVVLLPNKKAVLIDTPYEATGTESLLNWIKENYGELELTAIVTGYHMDNLGGNELLRSKGIDVYGADRTKDLVIQERESFKNFLLESVKDNEDKRYYNSYSELNLTPPNKTFPIHEGIKLEIENEVFEVYFPGESHTIDNTVVYLHNNKILFGGCMIKGLMYNMPGYLGFANMNEWPKSIEHTINRFPNTEIVVPGHGDIGGKEILSHSLKIVNDWNERTAAK